MKQRDEIMELTNVRLISAVYFGLLAVIGTILVDLVLYALGVIEALPFFQTVIISFGLSAFFGALYAKKIMFCKKPYKWTPFFWGALLVCSAFPVYNLLILILMTLENPQIFSSAGYLDYLTLFMILNIFFFIFAGFWMALAAGFAAFYLRAHFAYHLLHSQNAGRKLPVQKQTKMHRSSMPHRVRHSH